MKHYIIILLSVSLIYSCSNESGQESEIIDSNNQHSSKTEHLNDTLKVLHDNIIAIHDSVMPKINAINHYRLEIEKLLLDTLKTNDSLVSLYNDLHIADSSMIQWMKNHHETHFKYDDVKNKQILDQLHNDILIVRDRMNNSLKLAKEVLKVE